MSNRAWQIRLCAIRRVTSVLLAALTAVCVLGDVSGSPGVASPATNRGPDAALAHEGKPVPAVTVIPSARRCVTRSEFRRAKKRFTKARVERRIFKARPEWNPFVPKRRNIRGYPACKRGFFVEVDYTNLGRGRPYRLVRKGWYPQEGG